MRWKTIPPVQKGTDMKKNLATFKSMTILSIFGLALSQGLTPAAYAASATANATASVIAAIGITKVSDMDFGEGITGDSAKTVAPGTSETAANASFNVTGEPSRAYTIALPADGAVTLVTGDGSGATKQIAVTSFTSYPSAGANGVLTGGAESLFVGATRAALPSNQVTGSYAATFTVTVVY